MFFDDPAVTDDRLLMHVLDGEALAASIKEIYRQQETSRWDEAWTKVRRAGLDIAPPRPPKPKVDRWTRPGISLAEVARKLNLTRDHDWMLLAAGYFTPLPGAPEGQYAFDETEVDEFWAKLTAKVAVPTPSTRATRENRRRAD